MLIKHSLKLFFIFIFLFLFLTANSTETLSLDLICDTSDSELTSLCNENCFVSSSFSQFEKIEKFEKIENFDNLEIRKKRSLKSDDADENVPLAFALVAAAGLSTTFGSAMVFCDCFVKLNNHKFLAFALGFSGGVMFYVSMIEIFQKSILSFSVCECLWKDKNNGADAAYIMATICFFIGILVTYGLDFLVHLLFHLSGSKHGHSHHVDLEHQNGGNFDTCHKEVSQEHKNCQNNGDHKTQAHDHQDNFNLASPNKDAKTDVELCLEDKSCCQSPEGSSKPGDFQSKSFKLSPGRDALSNQNVSVKRSESLNSRSELKINIPNQMDRDDIDLPVDDRFCNHLHDLDDDSKSCNCEENCKKSPGMVSPDLEEPKELATKHSFGDGEKIDSEKDKKLLRMGMMTALAIGLHNFPEGLATFVATLASPSLGAPLAVAIAIHNIPEGLCVSIPIYYSTGSKWKAFLISFWSGITELIAAALGYAVLKEVLGDGVYGGLFGLVSGMMVTIVLKELIPTAHRYDQDDKLVTKGVMLGAFVMALSLVLFKF